MKRKQTEASAEVEPEAKKVVKSEVQVKQEPGAEQEPQVPDRAIEQQLGKEQLVALHKLEVLPKLSHGRKHPVRCNLCDGHIFEGRNRAKIVQHVFGLEHRRRWAASRSGKEVKKEPVSSPESASADGLVASSCFGLRLGSVMGQNTRLGGALLPVWQTYVKYANLDVPDDAFGHASHSITSLHSSGDWILQSVHCKKENVPVAWQI